MNSAKLPQPIDLYQMIPQPSDLYQMIDLSQMISTVPRDLNQMISTRLSLPNDLNGWDHLAELPTNRQTPIAGIRVLRTDQHTPYSPVRNAASLGRGSGNFVTKAMPNTKTSNTTTFRLEGGGRGLQTPLMFAISSQCCNTDLLHLHFPQRFPDSCSIGTRSDPLKPNGNGCAMEKCTDLYATWIAQITLGCNWKQHYITEYKGAHQLKKKL